MGIDSGPRANGSYIMVRQPDTQNQQSLALGLEPKCPLCGGPARRFGKGPGGIWTCTDNNCALDFTPIVTPKPKPGQGGAA
jgi:hypothetical protein